MTATIRRSDVDRRTVVTDDGVRLHVEVSGLATAPVLLMSNSLATDLHMWDAVVEQLSARFCVIRYDTRGHGRSEASVSCTIERLGRDVLAILDDLAIDRVTICGLSLGGATGLWLASIAPGRVTGLIVANSAAVFPTSDIWRQRARAAVGEGMAAIVAATLKRWFTPSFHAAHADLMATVGAMIEGTSPFGYAAACGALGELDLRGSLGDIGCPTRVIVGRADSSTPPSRGKEIRDAIPGADLVVLEAAHMSAIEDAAGFAWAVREFAS